MDGWMLFFALMSAVHRRRADFVEPKRQLLGKNTLFMALNRHNLPRWKDHSNDAVRWRKYDFQSK